MELNTFITESLKQIVDGVRGAQEHVGQTGAIINPEKIVNAAASKTLVDKETGALVVNVGFDVAITVNETTNREGGVKVAVGILNIGGHGQSENANSSVNKITFCIPMILPTHSISK